MKKLLACLLLISLLLGSCATAEDFGIQMVDLTQTQSVPISLDDVQLNNAYTLDGYAIFLPKEFKYVDCFAQFGENGDYSVRQKNKHLWDPDTSYQTVFCHSESELQLNSWSYVDAVWNDSGETAEFLWLLTDIVNLQQSAVNYVEEATVTVYYQDNYQFNGSLYQIVYDHMELQNGDRGLSRYGYSKEQYPNEITMNNSKTEPIDVMYTGTYAMCCKLPNYVVTDKQSPLRLEIRMGGNTVTYHIRK